MKIIRGLFCLFILGFIFLALPSSVQAATRTWDGEGNDNNWSTALNWSANTVPTSADAVVFSNTSTKDSTVDATYSGTVTTFNINSGYTGTVSLARSLTATTFTQATGTFTSGSNDTSFSSLVLSGGIFNASSGIATVSGAITISGSPTFNANAGRVSLTGGSATLSCNNVTFNLVTFNNTSTKTVNSNCSLPLGADPTIAQAASVSGTLSGSGAITTTAGTFTLASGATLSGFSGLTTGGAFTINGATVNFGSYSPVDINGAFTLTSGSFTAPSGTMTVSAAFTITTGTFNANGGTLTLDQSTVTTIACNNATFNLVTFNKSAGGTPTINSDCTLPLGSSPTATIGGTMALSGTLTGSGTLTITGGGVTIAATTSFNSFTDVSVAALTINTGATLTAPPGTLSLSGALTISGTGNFVHNSGTVNFRGGNATLSCNSVTFNSVTFTGQTGTKTVSSNCSLPLGADPTIPNAASVSGTLTGSGTITTTTGTFTLAGGATLSGFSGFTAGAAITIDGPTIDFGSYSPFTVDNAILTLTSGSLTVPSGGSVNSLTLTTGTFNAPSGIFTIRRNLSINGGTFNHNNGTINFTNVSNQTSTLSCNNVTFNLVTINSTTTTAKTINSNCTLPLGANPTIGGAASVSGTLSGSGLVTTTTGTLTLASPAVFSGFSGISAGLGITIIGLDLDWSGFSTLTTNTTTDGTGIALTSGSLTLPSGTDVGSLSMTTGTMNAPSGTITVRRDLSFTGGTFNHNNGTLNIAKSPLGNLTGTFSCNNQQFYLVTFNNSGSVGKTINSTCSFPLGSNPTIYGGVSLSGTLSGTGVLTTDSSGTSTSGMTLNTGAVFSGFSGYQNVSQGSFTVAGATVDFSSYDPVYVSGTFQITSGSFTAPAGLMRIGRNFLNNSGGTFDANGGTIEFDGDQHNITGSNTFNNFTKEATGASRVSFEASQTQTILGSLILHGQGENNLVFNSFTSGTQASIDPQGSRSVVGVNVRDSNNVNSTTIMAIGSVNSGNNTNWDFSTPLFSNFNLSSPGNNSFINSSQPTFSWQIPTAGSGGSISGFSLTVNNGSSGGFTLNNIPSSGNSGSSGSYSSSVSNGYVNLNPQGSNSLNEGVREWSVTVNDSSGFSQTSSSTVYVDLTGPSLNLGQIGDVELTSFPSAGLLTTDTTPTLFGTIADPVAGTPGVSSGPQSIGVQIQKQNAFGIYDVFSLTTLNISDVISGSDRKYSTFSYTPTDPLPYGKYQITMTPKDAAGNSGPNLVFGLSVNSYEQVVTSKEDEGVTKIIESKLPKLSEKQKQEIKEELEITKEFEPNPVQIAFAGLLAKLGNLLNFGFDLALGVVETAFRLTASTIAFVGNQIGSVYNFVASRAPGILHSSMLAFGDFVQGRVKQLNGIAAFVAFNLGERTQDISNRGGTTIVELGYMFVSEPTTISNVKVTRINKNSATISWKTNHPATGKVNYGFDETYSFEVQTSKRTTEHAFTLKGLKPNSTYFFEVMSQNKNYVYDANRKFKTLK